MPERIQRKRTKGFKMPANTVYVGRGSKWGNPHKVGISLVDNGDGSSRFMTPQDAADRYKNEYLPFYIGKGELDVSELRGKNLACWCKVGDPCHADVLLELANATSSPKPAQ